MDTEDTDMRDGCEMDTNEEEEENDKYIVYAAERTPKNAKLARATQKEVMDGVYIGQPPGWVLIHHRSVVVRMRISWIQFLQLRQAGSRWEHAVGKRLHSLNNQ